MTLQSNKILLIILSLLFLSSCTTLSNEYLTLNISSNQYTNHGKPFSIVVEHNSIYDNFVANDYQTISQQVLKDNINTYVIDPNKKQKNTFYIKADNTPLAIYFVFQETPIKQWKYYYKNPSNKSIYFNLTDGNILEDK